MKVILDLDSRYSEVLSITAVGHDSTYVHNIFTACIDLSRGTRWKMKESNSVLCLVKAERDDLED